MLRFVKEAYDWNYESIKRMCTWSYPLPKVDVGYSVYFVTFMGFCAYFVHWFKRKVEEDCKQPPPLFLKGKKISKSVTCNPDEVDFETINPKVHTVTDLRK